MKKLSLFFAASLAAMTCAAPAYAAPSTQLTNTPDTLPPLYKAEAERSVKFVSGMMAEGIIVPAPKDPGGGYTHEQHKRNYKAMYEASQLYRLTGDRKYAEYVRDMLLEYAELYPKLGPHPARNKQQYGKLFWQNLNDSVWLVYSSLAYEQIRGTLSAADRKNIDENVFRAAARFLSVDSKSTFNRIHNHATWATAGVGITGFVLGDDDMVERALLGSDKDGKTGFLRQTDLLFSPDGYYAEGPYYQRYALLPFMVFGSKIDQYAPERKIFERRDGILLKALRTTIQLTYKGYFFPFNDALKDKSLNTDELYQGVAIAYAETGDPGLLSIAQLQGRTILTEDGLALAHDIAAGKAEPFAFRSQLLKDGPEGNLGAVAIMRSGDSVSGQAVIAKNSSQGLGHGHFDKLSWQYYDNGEEIVTDYGAARFLNIVAKEGGRYLPENETWAKQSVAHNTLVVNETSHFDGDPDVAQKSAPKQLYFSASDELTVSTSRIDDAYDGVSITRTIAMVDVPGLEYPVIADIMRVTSNDAHKLDLPLHYRGQIMRAGPDFKSFTQARPVLGEANGYQHIWVDAAGKADAKSAYLTWLLSGRFYTWRWIPQTGAQVMLAESGANDPNFNLRREPMLIQRVQGQGDTVFAGVLETHGRYDGAAEQTVESDSQIKSISIQQTGGADVLVIRTIAGNQTAVAISYEADVGKQHSTKIDNKNYGWEGFAARIDLPSGEKQ